MKLYEARKSGWGAISFWWIVSCILIVPIFIIIIRILCLKAEKITFYEDKIVYETGILNKRKKSFAFTGVFSVDVNQSLVGRIFNYGDVNIDFVGKTDIETNYIQKPHELETFLEARLVKTGQVQTHMF